MRVRYLWMLAAAGFVALTVGACSKSEEKTGGSDLAGFARDTMEENLWEEEGVDIQAALDAAGLEFKNYHRFPAQELGTKGRVLTYVDKKNKGAGGVIFVKKTDAGVAPAWHWYFKDVIPDSVTHTEINEDGLWDVRIVSSKGKVFKYIQDDTFTLTAAQRTDWIALNGASSEPVTPDAPVWHCFDGDSVTAWSSSLAGGGGVFVEMYVPFGVSEGILSMRTTGKDQPQRCVLYGDGRKVQEFELEPKAALQMVKLNDSVKGAKEIRLVVESKHGSGDIVSIAELGLQ